VRYWETTIGSLLIGYARVSTDAQDLTPSAMG